MINESKTALILSSITNNSETKFEINILHHFFIHRYYMFDFAKKTKKKNQARASIKKKFISK